MIRSRRKGISLMLAVTLLLTSVFQIPGAAGAKGTAKSKKYYTISKKAGTYASAITVKIKVKKGCRVYYKISGKFKKSKVIQSGKSKTIKIKKTAVLSLCAVKNKIKTTNKGLNKTFRKKKMAYYAKYKYIILKEEDNSSNGTPTPVAEGSASPGNTTSTPPGTPSAGTSATNAPGSSTSPENITSTPPGTPPDGSFDPGSAPTPPDGSFGPGSAPTPPDGSFDPGNTPTPPSGSFDPGSAPTPPSGSFDPGSAPTPPTGGMMPGETPSPGISAADPEAKSAAQEKLNETESQLAAGSNIPAAKAASLISSGTPAITLAADGTAASIPEDGSITYENEGTVKTLTINRAGTYVLTGGTSTEPVVNTEIIVAEGISDEVNLIWDNLVIDNRALGKNTGEDVPVFLVGASTADVHVTLKGKSVLTGNGTYTEKPAAAIICADDAGTALTFSAYHGDTSASLTVVDGMAPDTDFGTNDPSDGIYCKGTLVMEDGTYNVTVNGDCLKGTGKNGDGGLWINDGLYTLHSFCGSALKSKSGNIVISGGNIKSEYTGGDGIQAKNKEVIITGGTITIDQCYGDGIQGENVNISGEATVIDIKTYFENAGINYYNTALGSGNYNTLSATDTSKTETVNVDTGSHKGIKGGTKAHTYCYKTVADGSNYVAGTAYTTEASGGIVISGGTIRIDTTNTGIKYNGNGTAMGTRPGSQPGNGSVSGGNLSAANSDGQYIIGSPDDGIHSNNSCVIAGGLLAISSADDGITGAAGVTIMNGCNITIDKCYEGIEGGEIIIGSSENSTGLPVIKIYSNDDGVNAASKSKVEYVYEDESEERYIKTQAASNDNTLRMLDGYLNIMIADDETHAFSLDNADGTNTSGSYTADGDGIDCNGAFYAYGGTIVVFGANSDGNSPIDTDTGYYIGSGVTLLAVGNGGMAENPAEKEQPVLIYGGSSGGFGGMMPGQGANRGNSASLSANTAFAFMKEDNVLLAMKPIKNYNYVLYSSPELENGSAYTVYSGGSVSGSLLQEESGAYDYRYAEYDISGATAISTVAAQH